jgi:hypothetical protein
MTPRDAEEMFVAQLMTVDRIIRSIAQRHALRGDDADDFASWVKLRLIDNEYAAIRKFQGRSALTTYLTVVIANLFRDYRVREWGRWRPSTAARRMGPVAMRLERLIVRDRLSADVACTAVECADPDVSRGELRRLAAALPLRPRQTRTDGDELQYTPAPGNADDAVWAAEASDQRIAIESALQRALHSWPS